MSEDGTLTASDTLTISDVDTSDNPISFNDQVSSLGGNGFGNFELTAVPGPTRSITPTPTCRHWTPAETLSDTLYLHRQSDSSMHPGRDHYDQRHGRRAGDRRHEQRAQCHRRRYVDGQRHADYHATSIRTDNPNQLQWTERVRTAGDNGYGAFEIRRPARGPTPLNNAHAAVQALDVTGQSLSDTLHFHRQSDSSARRS